MANNTLTEVAASKKHCVRQFNLTFPSHSDNQDHCLMHMQRAVISNDFSFALLCFRKQNSYIFICIVKILIFTVSAIWLGQTSFEIEPVELTIVVGNYKEFKNSLQL